MIRPPAEKNLKIPNSSTGKELGWLGSARHQQVENSMLASHRRVDKFGPPWGRVGGNVVNVVANGTDGNLSANVG